MSCDSGVGDPRIRAQGLVKGFRLAVSPWRRLFEAVFNRCGGVRNTALDHVSFDVASGEVLGVLGRNGAGKSTLLKILMGVVTPDSGLLSLRGRVTGLLELGTGFNPELSGRKNIYRNGQLLGMSFAEIADKEEKIIGFAELGPYIDEPLKSYSSGMIMRLGFAVGIHAEPGCFLVDEALSVGDGYFQQKCMQRIRQFRDEGGAIIFVSHDLNAVKMLCDRALVLDGGRVAFDGDPEGACNLYNQLMSGQSETQELGRVGEGVFGLGLAWVESAALLVDGEPRGVLCCGDSVTLRVCVAAKEHLQELVLGLMIRDRFGQDVFGVNTHQLNYPLAVAAGEVLVVDLALPMLLAPGKYTVTLALHEGEQHLDRCFWWCDGYVRFEVAGFLGHSCSGLVRLPVQVQRLS